MFIHYQTTHSSLFRAPIRTQWDPGYKSINNSTIKSPFLMEPISLERPLTSLSDGISLISNESKLREKRPLLHGIQLFPQTSEMVFWIYSAPRNHCNVCDFQHSLLIPLQPKLQKFYNLYRRCPYIWSINLPNI